MILPRGRMKRWSATKIPGKVLESLNQATFIGEFEK
jgi:hypothetical protein